MSNFPERIQFIKSVQSKLGLKVDGDDGFNTWSGIIKALNIEIVQPITTSLSPKALDLILKYEVGGGETYYNKLLAKPTWPAGASGVTIGIGYDLGYNSLSQFKKDWGDKLSAEDFERLSHCLGAKGIAAKSLIPQVKNIYIPWNIAFQVFNDSTINRWANEVIRIYPEADKLHPDAFGALVSLVFNRGTSLIGESRKEMLAIRQLVLDKDYQGIADEIQKMKRLWVGKGLNGLLLRRDEEAALIRSCAENS